MNFISVSNSSRESEVDTAVTANDCVCSDTFWSLVLLWTLNMGGCIVRITRSCWIFCASFHFSFLSDHNLRWKLFTFIVRVFLLCLHFENPIYCYISIYNFSWPKRSRSCLRFYYIWMHWSPVPSYLFSSYKKLSHNIPCKCKECEFETLPRVQFYSDIC